MNSPKLRWARRWADRTRLSTAFLHAVHDNPAVHRLAGEDVVTPLDSDQAKAKGLDQVDEVAPGYVLDGR